MYRTLSLGLLILLFAACAQSPERLPYLQQEIKGTDTTFKTIPDFKFLNQDSVVVQAKDFDKAIYVTDFFFTSCPTICPVMHRNMMKIYKKYEGNPGVKLASHTIDYKYDTPSRMKNYATKLGVKGTQWEFLWGERDSVYNLAEKHYLVTVGEDKAAPGGYIHQGYFILVDREKRIRGAYDGTVDEQVDKLMKDMDLLLKEYQ